MWRVGEKFRFPLWAKEGTDQQLILPERLLQIPQVYLGVEWEAG